MNEVVSLLVRSLTCSINLYLVELFTALANIITVLLLVSDLRIFLTGSNLAENLWTFKLIYSFERIYWPKINLKFSTPDRLQFTDTRWEKCVDKRATKWTVVRLLASFFDSAKFTLCLQSVVGFVPRIVPSMFKITLENQARERISRLKKI